ncbi:hypothetical protein [Verminephrobacter eiseniae]|uniref:hypothetical protein n=1 Tax=Verminephrobacter eiseniae TaxID=364317 RepID=UPI0022382CEF|nr:hypothetical protein [Verminephrobacter eiseniae]
MPITGSSANKWSVFLKRHPIDGDFSEHSWAQRIHHRFIGALCEFLEQPHHRLEVGHAFEAKLAFQHRIVPVIALGRLIAAAPDSIAAIDLDPLLVGVRGEGAMVVDALVERR